MLVSAELLAFPCGFYFLEDIHLDADMRHEAGLNNQTGIARWEVNRRGEARHCGREAKRVSFEFSLQPPTDPEG
jgi:hypothetical protein